MGNYCLIFMELSARDTPVFLFPDDNLSKHPLIFTKLSTRVMQKVLSLIGFLSFIPGVF